MIPVDKGDVDYADQRVIWRIRKERVEDYEQAAHFLNRLQPAAVSLQHEFGLFAGEMGEEVLRFVRALRVPLFVTLHTIEPQPRDIMKRILREPDARTGRDGNVAYCHSVVEAGIPCAHAPCA